MVVSKFSKCIWLLFTSLAIIKDAQGVTAPLAPITTDAVIAVSALSSNYLAGAGATTRASSSAARMPSSAFAGSTLSSGLSLPLYTPPEAQGSESRPVTSSPSAAASLKSTSILLSGSTINTVPAAQQMTSTGKPESSGVPMPNEPGYPARSNTANTLTGDPASTGAASGGMKPTSIMPSLTETAAAADTSSKSTGASGAPAPKHTDGGSKVTETTVTGLSCKTLPKLPADPSNIKLSTVLDTLGQFENNQTFVFPAKKTDYAGGQSLAQRIVDPIGWSIDFLSIPAAIPEGDSIDVGSAWLAAMTTIANGCIMLDDNSQKYITGGSWKTSIPVSVSGNNVDLAMQWTLAIE